MKDIYCPHCEKPTRLKIPDLLPWFRLARERFWCRTCHEWFSYSERAIRNATAASLGNRLIGCHALAVLPDFGCDKNLRLASFRVYPGRYLALQPRLSNSTLAVSETCGPNRLCALTIRSSRTRFAASAYVLACSTLPRRSRVGLTQALGALQFP